MFRSPEEVLHSGSTFASGISQRQKEWGIHERSVVTLPSVQDLPRRLQCVLKFHPRHFLLDFNPHKQFHKTTYIWEGCNPCWPFSSHFTLVLSSAQVKFDSAKCKGAVVCIVPIGFFWYHLYLCRFDWILKLSLIFEKSPNSDCSCKDRMNILMFAYFYCSTDVYQTLGISKIAVFL